MALELNQRVVWWRGPSNGRLTAIHGSVLAQRNGRVHVLLNDGRRRWVDLERIQTIRWRHHTWPAPDHIPFEPPLNEWGACTIHCEINEDLFPNRCVYEFENGKYLRYDRRHWFDHYGSLGTLAYCHFRWKEFWGNTTEICQSQFDEIWQRAAIRDEDVAKLNREIPEELSEIKPWTRRPIEIGKKHTSL